MSETLKIKTLILIMIAGSLLTSSTLMPIANAQPTQTALTITVPSPPKEKPSTPQEAECTIEATLKDENGNPLPNKIINFYKCGSSLTGTAKTNSIGVASTIFTPDEASRIGNIEFTLRTVTYKINAVFYGATNYAKSSSEDVYIEYIFRDIDIFLDYPQYLVGGGLIAVGVAIIGAAGFIVFRRRKKQSL
jgi:hypothetical protein